MFEIWGITFHFYGFLLGLGVLAAIEVSVRRAGKNKIEILEKMMWWILCGGVIGARLYHVIDYWGDYYSMNLIKIFCIWEGGLGIWGAIIGGLIALWMYCHFNKLNLLEYLDNIVIGLPLAQAIGRLGNFVNGELYGKNGEPLFAYEGILNLTLFFILWFTSKRNRPKGVLTGIYFLGYGMIRFSLENLRPTEEIWKFFGFPVAQLFSMLAIIYGGYLILFRKRS